MRTPVPECAHDLPWTLAFFSLGFALRLCGNLRDVKRAKDWGAAILMLTAFFGLLVVCGGRPHEIRRRPVVERYTVGVCRREASIDVEGRDLVEHTDDVAFARGLLAGRGRLEWEDAWNAYGLFIGTELRFVREGPAHPPAKGAMGPKP